MPRGTVTRFDEATGEGRIVDDGRRYVCRAEDMERAARETGTHVHFDVSQDGIHAVRVTVRPGGQGLGPSSTEPYAPARVDRPDRRATRDPGRDDHVASPLEPELRALVRPTPLRVAQWWSAALADGRIDDVVRTIEPGATVEVHGETVQGGSHLRAAFGRLEVAGCGRKPDLVQAEGDAIRISWFPVGEIAATDITVGVRDGEISSVEVGVAGAPDEGGAEPGYPIEVVCRGRQSGLRRGEAVEKIVRALESVHEPVLAVRLKLTQLEDPAAQRPSIAEATVDVNGDLVRAHASAQNLRDATDHLERRLRDRLVRRRGRRDRDRHAGAPVPQAAPSPESRPESPTFDRPVEERELVRHKTWSAPAATVDEAIEDLEALDHDFHLFTEETTGLDAMLRRVEGGYQLAFTAPVPSGPPAAESEVVVDPRPVPDLTLQNAITRLELTGDHELFFKDVGTGRGNAVYRRYDGHYGLITPV